MGSFDSVINEISFIKLARWTYSYKFVDSFGKEIFFKLLCHNIENLCSSYSSWKEVLKVFHLESDNIDDPREVSIWKKYIRKRYRIQKGFFSPKISYKYFFAFLICHIHTTLGSRVDALEFKELCASIGVNKKQADLFLKMNSDDESYSAFMTRANKWNGFNEILNKINKHISREAEYYKLPRKNVSVFSTMSAGKSTFVNALLGHDYLPSRNEACTAKIVSISDIDYINYCLGYALKDGKTIFCADINSNIVEEWNNNAKISKITLEGNLDRISSERFVTVIHDTPGVNYSGNTSHKKLALKHISESHPDIIICLLDATQMLTTDFSEALHALLECNKNSNNANIIFAVNKADSYDYEKESLKECIIQTASELLKYDVENPVVIPVSARAARLFKMALHNRASFTENEIDDFVHYLKFFSRQENDFRPLAIGVSERDRNSIKYANKKTLEITIEGKIYKNDAINKALFCTGIPVVENILNQVKENYG
jgi:GTPase SAR1 family protein